jgi:hypothetical protein
MNQIASASATNVQHAPTSGAARVGYFLRHLGEMVLAMVVGMAVGAAVLALMFATLLEPATRGMTSAEVLSQFRFALLVCLVMAVTMTAPMVAWMRHRGHDWRSCAEMAVAMLVPVIPIMGLVWLQVLPGAAACCLYCGSMIPATIVAMLFRLDLYTGHVGHVAHAAA